MSFKDQIIKERLPKHVAVIMDGNGRWARLKGRHRVFGHKNGVQSVREVSEAAAELGIEYLTLYAFSTENWKRPMNEIEALMTLLVSTINSETKTLMENNIRLNAIGDLSNLPDKVSNRLQKAIDTTSANNGMTLTLALSYSGRWEITEAIKQIAAKASAGDLKPEDINDHTIQELLQTRNIPDPELLIRTSGEFRISNFLLWQLAYCELYFTDVLWPDFRRDNFYEALCNYQSRERRFGKISEQINSIEQNI